MEQKRLADARERATLELLYPGHILRMEAHRVTRRVLLQCSKPAPESLFGDVPGLDVHTAINLAMNRGLEEQQTI